MLIWSIALFYFLLFSISFLQLFSWKLRKKSVSLQREHKIAKIWQDTSTHSQTGRSNESSARNTAKTCLIEFLNQLLLGEQHITDVKFKDKEMLPETKDQRGIIYDVFCETDTGEHIIVEMQNRSQSYFIDLGLSTMHRKR